MNKLLIFTDGSVNPQTKVGFGAFLKVNSEDIHNSQELKVQKFNNSSSTKLELQTLIWALSSINSASIPIIVYTDSQNIIGLPDRKQKLENTNYVSSKGKLFANHELYKQFYTLAENLNIELVKLVGHLKSRDKTEIDKLFNIVDKASRKALRDFYSNI